MRPALLLLLAAAASAQLAIDFAAAPLRADYVGVSAVRHGFDYFPEEVGRGLTPSLRNLSYARLAAARLSHARSWYASEWAMPNGWGGGLDFHTPSFEAFAAWVADMRDRNVSVVWNAGWWFTQATCGPGLPGSCTPSNASLQVYYEWVSESARELVATRGLTNADTLLIFTEPLDYASGLLPPGYTQDSLYALVARGLHDYMTAAGTRALVRFQGPNGVNLAGLGFAVDALGDVLDVFSCHDYSLGAYEKWLAKFTAATALTRASGKPLWVDEGGLNGEGARNASDYGTYLALWHAAAVNAGASSTFVWLWQDQYYVWPLENATNSDSFANGLHRWGLQLWLPDSLAVRPAFYAHGILARFLRAPQGAAHAASVPVAGVAPGSIVGAAITGTPALGRPDYRAVLVVNEGQAPANVTVALSGAGGGTFFRYLFDPAAPPSDALPVQPSGSAPGPVSQLTDTLPARAFAVWATQWEGA
jgi:hypothetical protein